MRLDPDKAEERLNSPLNLANRLKAFREGHKLALDNGVLEKREGRVLPRLPDAIKEEIRERANSGLERQEDIAQEYGITQGAVSYLKRTEEKEIERESHDSEKEKKIEELIKDEASAKMLLAMGLLTEEKLANIKARDIAAIAANMARVRESVTPKSAQGASVNLMIYTPEVREEKSFKIVEIEKAS